MSAGGAPTDLTVDCRRLARAVLVCCAGAELLFVVLDYQVNYGRATDIGAIRRLFNIAREDGLASWFGTTQTVLVALTLWLVYAAVRGQGAPRWRRGGWLVLALVLTYMAADDGAQLHERLGTAYKVTQEYARRDGTSSSWLAALEALFPSYTWQVLFVPLWGVFGAYAAAFLWVELERPGARTLVLAALGCFAFAVALDFIEGLSPGHPWNVHAMIGKNEVLGAFAQRRFHRSGFDAVRHFSKSLEEFVEMLGMTFLWAAFLGHVGRAAGELRLRFVGRRA